MDIKIRSLKRSDRKRLTAMIEQLAEKIGSDEILNMISSVVSGKKVSNSSDSDENIISLGIQVINLLRKFLEEEFSEWLASLVDKSIEELDDMPFDVEVQIIEQVVNATEFTGFFSGASRLVKKIKQYLPVSIEKSVL